MKTISGQHAPILLNNWDGKTSADVLQEFDGERWNYSAGNVSAKDKPEFSGVEILLASYGTPEYEGYAFVLFRKDGKLYEVNGSHCSCFGLEGQWEPEETTVDALRHRIANGDLGKGVYNENPFAAELEGVLSGIAGQPCVHSA